MITEEVTILAESLTFDHLHYVVTLNGRKSSNEEYITVIGDLTRIEINPRNVCLMIGGVETCVTRSAKVTVHPMKFEDLPFEFEPV